MTRALETDIVFSSHSFIVPRLLSVTGHSRPFFSTEDVDGTDGLLMAAGATLAFQDRLEKNFLKHISPTPERQKE